MAQIIQLRRDYSSNWTLANPVLAQGELGIEFDNYNVKIGNGLSSWNELPYGLGTASLPAHTHPYAGTGITTASTSGINIAGTLNSSGLSLGIPAWLTTYSSAAGGGDWTAATVSGTDMLVSTGAGTNTIYYPKYITTAADPVHAHTQYLTTAMVSDAGSNFMGSNYTSHTHNYQSTGNYLTTAMLSNMTSVLQYTSNTSNITSNAINTSVTSAYQLIANSTASLGTIYTSHTHNYQSAGAYLTTAMASENTSIYQLTANNSLSLDTGYTTHTHQYQSTGAYLTTAAQVSHTHGSISIASTAGTDFTYSSASNGMSFSIPKWITTYAAGGGEIDVSAGGSSASLASLVFSNASGVSFGLNGSTITATVKTDYQPSGAYLTTAAQSNQVVNSFNGSTGQISFVTGSGMSTTTNASTLTFGLRSDISTAWSGQTTANQSRVVVINGLSNSISFATGSSLSSSINGSTITFGLASNITTALQSAGAYLTTGALSDHTHSNLYLPLGNSTQWATSVLDDSLMALSYSSAFQTSTLASTFAQTANVMLTGERANYFYTSNNTLANSTHAHGGLTINVTNVSTSITSASNGLTINLSVAAPGAGGGIAASIGGNSTSGGAGYSNITSGTMLLAGGNNITLSQVGSAITIVGGAGGGGAAIAAAGATVTNNTVIFSNSNGVSFGGNGSTITAQIAGVGTVNFADSNGITWGSSTNGVSTTITGSIAAYGGTSLSTVSTTGSVLLGGINTAGISLSVPAWLTAAAGGAGAPNRSVCEIIPGEYLTRLVNLTATAISGRIIFNPFWLGGDGLIASTVRIIMSVVTNTAPPIMTYGAALYSMLNSTQLSLVDSTTATVNYASSQSASYSGIRAWDITGMTKSLTEGRYVLGLFFSGSASVAMNASLYGASAWPAIVGFVSGASDTLATNNTVHLFPFQGAYSAVSSEFPNTVGITQIRGGRAAEAIDYYAIIKQI